MRSKFYKILFVDFNVETIFFTIERLNLDYIESLLHYYSSNKDHLEPCEPTRASAYYTLNFHIHRTQERIKLMDEKKSMHFILLNNSRNEIIGVCNYTDIGKKECWLGFSASSHYQGLGYMYEALMKTNNYIFRELQISRINAGIIPRNSRSIKLIKRLSFISSSSYKKLEINGSVEQLEIYSLKKNLID